MLLPLTKRQGNHQTDECLPRYFFETLLKRMQHEESLHVNHSAVNTIKRSKDERLVGHPLLPLRVCHLHVEM